MRIQPATSLRRAAAVLLLSISVFSAAYLLDNPGKFSIMDAGNDKPEADDLLIGRIAGNERQKQREAAAAEQARQQEKAQASEAVIANRPKSSNVSFFLSSPFRANLMIPESWQGRYRAEESGRQFDLVYASSSGQTAKLLAIYLFNDSEWAKYERRSGYQVLEKMPGFVFAYREFVPTGLEKNAAEEYVKMTAGLSDVIKSFKSQKQ